MRKYILFYILFISIISANTIKYNTVVSNSLEPHPVYTWKQFLYDIRVVPGQTNARFWSTHFEGTFTTEYMTWIAPIYKSDDPSDEFVQFTQIRNRAGEEIPIPDRSDFILREDDFHEFRKVFSDMECKRFDNGFEVNYYKILTAKNQNEIIWSSNPSDTASYFLSDSTKHNPIIYYAYGHVKRGKDEYVILGIQNYFAQASFGSEGILGWVQTKKDGEEQLAVLWNSAIGVRPKENPKTPPIVFPRSGIDNGYNEIRKYVSRGIEPDSLIVDSRGLDNYYTKFHEQKGGVFRWLPMYDAVEGKEKYVMRCGITTDVMDLYQDLMEILLMNEYQIVFLLDGSASMTYVWKNLPDILKNTLSHLINHNFKNIKGDEITPKIKIFYWKGSPTIYSYINSEWIENETDVDSEYYKLQNFKTEGTGTVRVPIARTVESILSMDEIGNSPTYFVVFGDASDVDYNGQDLSTLNMFDPWLGSSGSSSDEGTITSQYFELRGIRIQSSPWFSSQSPNPNMMDFISAYDEFMGNFGGELLWDEKVDFSQNISSSVVEEIGTSIADMIIQDVNSISSLIASTTKSGLDDKQIQSQFGKHSPFGQAYLDKIRKYFANSKYTERGAHTYFQDGLILAKGSVGHELLLETDVHITDDKLAKLFEALNKYVTAPDIDKAKKLVRKTLSIFFDEEMENVDMEFMEKTTLKSFWNNVLGDNDISKFLIPGIFDNNYSFRDLTHNLTGNRDVETKFLSNASDMFTALQKYYNSNNGEGYSKIETIANYETNETVIHYFVNSKDIMLFNDLPIMKNKN